MYVCTIMLERVGLQTLMYLPEYSIRPECSIGEGGAVGPAADGPDLAGQAHHGRLDVEVRQVDRFRLIPTSKTIRDLFPINQFQNSLPLFSVQYTE